MAYNRKGRTGVLREDRVGVGQPWLQRGRAPSCYPEARPRLRWRLLTLAKLLACASVLVALVGAPTVHANSDVLAGVAVAPWQHRADYRRAAFGKGWAEDAGGCDLRDDILNRDLTNVTHVSTKRCQDAVATGILHDPYTGKTILFTRGAVSGEAVQIDHIVPLAYAWDMGAASWSDAQRLVFANDPAELIAVDGPTNQAKSDYPPERWMPPNTAFDCQYATAFAAVLRKYQLPIDPASVPIVQRACAPTP